MKNDFSIVKIGGSQYKVMKGDVLEVEKLDGKDGDKLTFDSVLMTAVKGKATIGTPTVKGAKVEAKILEQKKDKKMYINKFKAKARYRRRIGHRQFKTRIEITKI